MNKERKKERKKERERREGCRKEEGRKKGKKTILVVEEFGILTMQNFMKFHLFFLHKY